MSGKVIELVVNAEAYLSYRMLAGAMLLMNKPKPEEIEGIMGLWDYELWPGQPGAKNRRIAVPTDRDWET